MPNETDEEINEYTIRNAALDRAFQMVRYDAPAERSSEIISRAREFEEYLLNG